MIVDVKIDGKTYKDVEVTNIKLSQDDIKTIRKIIDEKVSDDISEAFSNFSLLKNKKG